MPDGSPQVTPAWVDHDGDRVVINTAEGRAKPRNMRNDPRVALSATDPDNPYEAVLRQSGEQGLKVYIEPEVVRGANE